MTGNFQFSPESHQFAAIGIAAPWRKLSSKLWFRLLCTVAAFHVGTVASAALQLTPTSIIGFARIDYSAALFCLYFITAPTSQLLAVTLMFSVAFIAHTKIPLWTSALIAIASFFLHGAAIAAWRS